METLSIAVGIDVTKRPLNDAAAAARANAARRAHPRTGAQPPRRERPSKWTCPRCGTRKLLRGDRPR